MRAEIALVSLGGDQAAAVGNLATHLHVDPLPLLLVLHEPLPPIQDAMLRNLTDVRTIYVSKGLGRARGTAIRNAQAEALVMIDDDAALTPIGGFSVLAETAITYGSWVVPIIRYACNLVSAGRGLIDHTEIWQMVEREDPRVATALDQYGQGWIRVYDTGEKLRETDRMGGTCHALLPSAVPGDVLDTLADWPIDAGQEDDYLAAVLGPGLVHGEVFAYHWGDHWAGKWLDGPVAEKVAEHRSRQA